ncbi:MAG: DUF2461 domain-containing protein [Actinobacteria bacterium]|nr:DUF2461 domain-containing protein [Actinomycetota bacterium]
MTFTGIPLAALDFYEDLEADNSKSFWTAHKHVYDESVRAPVEALAAELSAEFGTAKIFRPYRDVRFAKDKTPYKTAQGVWFGETSCYVHISAEGIMIAGGYWQTTGAQVVRLRRAVGDDVAGPALERALATLRQAKFDIGGTQIARVPSGFDKDHPRADLLNYKTLTAHRQLGAPAWLSTKRASNEITKAFRSLAPLTTWLDTNVGHDLS